VDVLNFHMNVPHSFEGDEGLKGPQNLVRLLPGDIIGGIIAPSHRARRTQPRSLIPATSEGCQRGVLVGDHSVTGRYR
jgi:hypothetical protein